MVQMGSQKVHHGDAFDNSIHFEGFSRGFLLDTRAELAGSGVTAGFPNLGTLIETAADWAGQISLTGVKQQGAQYTLVDDKLNLRCPGSLGCTGAASFPGGRVFYPN